MTDTTALKRTALHADHLAAGARLVAFAGFEMPLQYSEGISAEHVHCRRQAGLFDVSHMGQTELSGADFETVARALETIIPADVLTTRPGRQKYSQLITDDGGIVDDLMFARPPAGSGRDNSILLVVNASRLAADVAHLKSRLPADVVLTLRPDLALIALQGPMSEAVLAVHIPDIVDADFMDVLERTIQGLPVMISRSGYTGEDGFEISIPAKNAAALWALLLLDERVKPIGLGARDTLRLEAGFCLYGADINTLTTPVQAALNWSIPTRRRQDGGFPGADTVCRELKHGALIKRVGLQVDAKIPVRAGAVLFSTETSDQAVGFVTSGGIAPTTDHPIAMANVQSSFAQVGAQLFAEVRGKRIRTEIVQFPFIPARFKRSKPGIQK